MTDDWLCKMDKDNTTEVIHIDLNEAFDTINNRIMTQKVAAHDVINKGVPHGTILGPMLFTLYVNDLPDLLDESIQKYADDGTL